MEKLKEIALEMRKWHLEKEASENRTSKQMELLDRKIFIQRQAFMARAYEKCAMAVYGSIKKKQSAWSNHTNLPLKDVFDDLFFKAVNTLIENFILSDKDLSNFNTQALITFIINKRLIDYFRKINKAGFIYKGEEDVPVNLPDEELSIDEKLDLEQRAKNILAKFQSIVPNKVERVFLRWYWIYKPGDDQIALVYEYSNPGSVKVKRARLMNRIMEQMEEKRVIAAQEFNMTDDVVLDPDKMTRPAIPDNLQNQLIDLLIKGPANKAKEKFKALFQKAAEKRILLRWHWLLQPQALFMANAYEFNAINDFINYKRSIINEVVNMLSNNNLLNR